MEQRRVNEALGFLETLFPERIGEACVIGADGHEVARVVDLEAASDHELSTTEQHTPFFAPTLALQPGEVYRAAPYISPDTHDWVVAHSTMLPFVTKTKAFVHFELTIKGFANGLRAAANPTNGEPLSSGFTLQIVDARTGTVIADSAGRVFPQQTRRSTRWWKTIRAREGGLSSHDGRRFAIVEATDNPTNANHWLVVASAPRTFSPLVGSGLPLWLGIAGLFSLLFGLVMSRLYERYLERAAHHDALTGLANRRRLNEALGDVLASHRNACVLLVDLDRFKDVNDTFGHEIGDALLGAVGERLVNHSHPTDLVTRMGGDEFAVLIMRGLDEQAAVDHAHWLHGQLLRPYFLGDLRIDLEASVGVALSVDGSLTGSELLHRADQAMYSAKELRLGVELYQFGHESLGQRQLLLLGELREAIERHELVVHFQPKVSFTEQTICGIEALVRWNHPTRGLLPPAEFIEFAEQTSLIRPLTLKVIDLTLTQIRAWLDAGVTVKVAVNISTRSLLDTTLCHRSKRRSHDTPVARRSCRWRSPKARSCTTPCTLSRSSTNSPTSASTCRSMTSGRAIRRCRISPISERPSSRSIARSCRRCVSIKPAPLWSNPSSLSVTPSACGLWRRELKTTRPRSASPTRDATSGRGSCGVGRFRRPRRSVPCGSHSA